MDRVLITLWATSLAVFTASLVLDWLKARRDRAWPKRIATPHGELMVFECGATLLRDSTGGLRVIMQGALRPAPPPAEARTWDTPAEMRH